MGGGGGLLGGGGGGGGGTTINYPQPQPINYDKMAAASIRVANNQIAAEEAAIKRLYPEYIRMQFGTADQLAGKLDNEYSRRNRGIISEELQAASAPSQIEAELQRQAQEELALGRSLTPEQERAATQSARAAMAARGMATGNAAVGAEILNRDAYGQQRLDQRRQFALGANQLDLARRQRRIGLGGIYQETDPYRQALGPAFGLGGDTLRTSQGQVSNIFGNALGQAGNVASFNTNMQAGMYNNAMNNNAALQAARITGSAAQSAGMMSMFGGVAQGAGSFFSDKRMKKDIKPVGKDGVLGLKTYEYRYKGEGKDAPKRVGYMAQDVQKVLPEAVEEVSVKGKKRLAIKPAVIGQALAAALTAEQEAMFADGYTVK